MRLAHRLLLALLAALAITGTVAAQNKGELPRTNEKMSDEVLAQQKELAVAANPNTGRGLGSGIGMGLAIIGVGIGIGLVGYAALSGIARQPEQAGAIQGAMFILAGLVEGAGIIALVLCLALVFL
jgi:ATP synthase F0 subunit c